MRIALVHYHLRPGGVTSVLARTCEGLARLGYPHVVLCGEPPETGSAWTHPWAVVPGLAYGTAWPDPGFMDTLQVAARRALGGPPDLWHIHNHALGKSPGLPVCVDHLARAGQPLLLHLHDFPEDGRPAAYRALPAAGLNLYPGGQRVHYAVLNRRDHAILLQAGAPPERVQVLPNPVQVNAGPRERTPAPVVTYPTRAIRRKNLGEFLLWAAAGKPDTRWQTTLAPRSEVDRTAYQRWSRVVEDLHLPVDLAVSEGRDRSLADILAGSQSVMTTSVAEGFGLAFLEPWLAGCPVWGRDLPEITADFRAAGLDLSHLYTHLPVPVEWLGRDRVRTALDHGLERVCRAYGRACDAAMKERLWSVACVEDRVDFGRLDEGLQEEVVRRVQRDAEARPLLVLDEAARWCPQTRLAHNRRIVETAYSPAAFAERLLQLYRNMLAQPPDPDLALDRARVLDLFLSPERFTLLRT